MEQWDLVEKRKSYEESDRRFEVPCGLLLARIQEARTPYFRLRFLRPAM